MLRRQDVGHRIVVRRIVGIRDGNPLFSDALGELVELTETHLTVATAKGKLRVPLAEVHRAKRVPPARRPTAPAVVALELAANEAWPAPVQDRLGDWLLRAADGWTGRANSALPIGDPDRPLAAAIDAIERWYVAHHQRPMINVPLPLAGPVGAALDERGWESRPPVLVQTAPLASIRDRLPARADLPPVELAAAPSAGWLALATSRKAAATTQLRAAGPDAVPPGTAEAAGPGAVPPGTAEAAEAAEAAGPGAPAEAGAGRLPAAAVHVLTAVPRVRFAHLYGDARPGAADRELLAIARGTVTGNGRWLGLVLIEVAPGARRRGLAQHLIRALADWATGLGATDAFLQVEERNAAAVALYRRLGFTTHHTYLSRLAPRRDN